MEGRPPHLAVVLPEDGRRHLGAVHDARQVQHRPDVDVQGGAGAVTDNFSVRL